MTSLRYLYRIGKGPSSSHTMGPFAAAKKIKEDFPKAASFRVTLYGSLAATGKGHLTDQAIIEGLAPLSAEVVWRADQMLSAHPNGMQFEILDPDAQVIETRVAYSIGGGEVTWGNTRSSEGEHIYTEKSFAQISERCCNEKINLWEYVLQCEGEEIIPYLDKIYEAMRAAVKRGLHTEGLLPGSLKYQRKAAGVFQRARRSGAGMRLAGEISARALAVSEENGNGGIVVTAPTCGACGVVPGLLTALVKEYALETSEIRKSLGVAGIVGNLIKHNASISGAVAGCQAEVGSACSMAAAMTAFLFGADTETIGKAAEVAMEHHLGMTCDPVRGYVQIPCIERNALGALRALDSANYVMLSDKEFKIPFDKIVKVMLETGQDIMGHYRETSTGGLAKFYEVDL